MITGEYWVRGGRKVTYKIKINNDKSFIDDLVFNRGDTLQELSEHNKDIQ